MAFFDNLSYSVIIIMFWEKLNWSLLDSGPLQSVVKKLVLFGLFLSQIKRFWLVTHSVCVRARGTRAQKKLCCFPTAADSWAKASVSIVAVPTVKANSNILSWKLPFSREGLVVSWLEVKVVILVDWKASYIFVQIHCSMTSGFYQLNQQARQSRGKGKTRLNWEPCGKTERKLPDLIQRVQNIYHVNLEIFYSFIIS